MEENYDMRGFSKDISLIEEIIYYLSRDISERQEKIDSVDKRKITLHRRHNKLKRLIRVNPTELYFTGRLKKAENLLKRTEEELHRNYLKSYILEKSMVYSK